MLFGENPYGVVFLALLGLQRVDIPRYRDCWWDGEYICVYTRTGGGNREYYDSADKCRANYPEYFEGTEDSVPSGPWNDDLRALPTFVRDVDDDYDCTYATFYFRVPESLQWVIPHLSIIDKSPADRWQELISKLNDPATADDADVQRATKVMEPLLDAITKALKDKI